MKRLLGRSVCAAGLALTVVAAAAPVAAADLGKIDHFRVSPHNHIAARHFCLAAVHHEKETEKLSEERFLSLAYACSRGHFNRVFTELSGNSRDGLVAHKGRHGLEVIHEWERDVRSAIAKAPHLELK